MRKLVLVSLVLSMVLIIIQGRIIKRNDRWACEWECSSYYPYTQHRGLDSTNILEIFGIGRKKRGAYSWYRSDCDCNISW